MQNKNEPIVACLTNTVAAGFTANCLLAIGAKPAMVEDADEAQELVAVADALLVNVGTLTEEQARVMRAAVETANRLGKPWVLDPVATDLLSLRRKLVFELLERYPAIIRGNHREIEFILGTVPQKTGAILSTGETDRIWTRENPDEWETVSGGVEMMTKVTATGCAQGAICAAMLGFGKSPSEAARSASKLMKRAGELAWERAKRPGSFQIALIDALWELTHEEN